jgi:hypothetical protein
MEYDICRCLVVLQQKFLGLFFSSPLRIRTQFATALSKMLRRGDELRCHRTARPSVDRLGSEAHDSSHAAAEGHDPVVVVRGIPIGCHAGLPGEIPPFFKL